MLGEPRLEGAHRRRHQHEEHDAEDHELLPEVREADALEHDAARDDDEPALSSLSHRMKKIKNGTHRGYGWAQQVNPSKVLVTSLSSIQASYHEPRTPRSKFREMCISQPLLLDTNTIPANRGDTSKMHLVHSA